MKKKIAWLILSCLIVVALVLASCRPAAVEEEGRKVVGKVIEKKEVVKEEAKKEVVPTKEEPQYGGTLTALHLHPGVEPAFWDPAEVDYRSNVYVSPYMEQPLVGDLNFGPRGTKQWAFNDPEFVPMEFVTGQLAESWELADPLTLVYHLRKGIYFPDKPRVMSSREMTADDWVFCLNRLMEGVKGKSQGYYDRFATPGAVKALDKYTVQLKMKEYDDNWRSMAGWGYYPQIYPQEVVKAGIADWKNANGTGPFMLKDYVSGASLTYEKNPVYWGTTTIAGKEYKLPFIDRLVWPLIIDESTQIAALRTAKVDLATNVSWRYKDSLAQTNPELIIYRWQTGGFGGVAARHDVKPFDDIRVRRALSMAIDRQAYIDTQLGGEGILVSGPFAPRWPETIYTPLEKLPPSAQEVFQYNPEKAKQLLSEAGYPNGFKAEFVIIGTGTTPDLAAMLVADWKKIGVEVELKPYDYATYLGIQYMHAHKHMLWMSKGHGDPVTVLWVIGMPKQFWNPAEYNDPYFIENLKKARGTSDLAVQYQILKELNVRMIDQVAYIVTPIGYYYFYLYPWVKNHYGEFNTGCRSQGPVYARAWLDRDLRAKMTGKR